MRRSTFLCAVIAVGCTFASTAFADFLSQSASIQVADVVESDTFQGGGAFNKTVQDSYSATNGRLEGALAQQKSSVSLPNFAFNLPGDISSSGEVRFNVSGPGGDNVSAADDTRVTFTLDGPASFNLTEQSSMEIFGGDGEIGTQGATLIAGTTPATFLQPNLIPYISTLWQQEVGVVTTPLPPPLTYSGTLAPGTYTYEMFAEGHDSEDANEDLTFSSDLQITPTPEPSSAAALTLAAIALLARRRRHAN